MLASSKTTGRPAGEESARPFPMLGSIIDSESWAAIRRPILGLARTLKAADRILRLHFLQFSWMLILLGGASALATGKALGPVQIAGLLAIGVCFHLFAYVLNDVVDLPVDRTQPSRRNDPLVSGRIRPAHALAFALVQVPLGVGLVVLLGASGTGSAGTRAAAALLAGFVFMAIYDVWGKKCPVPPLTDLAQGLGWASLVLCGAFLTGEPTPLTCIAFLYGAGFILLINGVHGGLRDLANDLRSGCRTTAIFFGGRPGREVTRGLRLFAGTVQAGLVAVTLVPLLRNDFGYPPATLAATSALVIALDLGCLWNLHLVFQPERPGWGLAFRFHLFLLLVTWMALFLPSLDPLAAGALVAGFLVPLLFFDATHQVLGRAVAAVGEKS